jgi:predicted aminopeptidase
MLLCLTGCTTLGYYAQAIDGHLDLMARRQPIEQVSRNPDTSVELREKLAQVLALREFASRGLGLPANDSYRTYVALRRPYVVWNVFAAEEFALEPKTWCFLVAGCVSYRGYFSRDSAYDYARELRTQGYDVFVAGAIAYSTLGWFDDPLPSPLLTRSLPEVAGVIFHELAHQRLYVKDDSAFNEAFAVTVERQGVERWLSETEQTEAAAAYRKAQLARDEFLALVAAIREELTVLYSSNLSEDDKRLSKSQILRSASNRAGSAQASSKYRNWLADGLNNAKLVSVATYYDLVPGFANLLAVTNGDLDAFYQAAESLAALPREHRRTELQRLSRRVRTREPNPAALDEAG